MPKYKLTILTAATVLLYQIATTQPAYDTQGLTALIDELNTYELIKQHSINPDGSYKYYYPQQARPIDAIQPVIIITAR